MSGEDGSASDFFFYVCGESFFGGLGAADTDFFIGGGFVKGPLESIDAYLTMLFCVFKTEFFLPLPD